MTSEEARQLLGLGAEQPTLAALRAARNSALKAHHPDLVGSDEAAKRRATYWSAQLNRAYTTLEAEIGTKPPSGSSPAADPQRQSFGAAAKRAAERAAATEKAEAARIAEQRRREAEAARAAQAREEQRAAVEKAAREARALASERRAAEAHAARQATAQARQPDGDQTVGRTSKSGLSTRKGLLVGGLALALLAAAAIGSARSTTPASAAAPSVSAGPVLSTIAPTVAHASPPPLPTPRPTDRPAKVSFDYWLNMERTAIAPCFMGGTCTPDAVVEYTDRAGGTLADEVVRVTGLYSENYALAIGSIDLCTDEMGSTFAQLAALEAEIRLARLMTSGETVPAAWAPVGNTGFEACGTGARSADKETASIETSITDALSKLEKAKALIRDKDWAGTQTVGQELAAVGTDLARAAARDVAPTGPWQRARAAATTVLDFSSTLQIKRLAQARSTPADLDALRMSLEQLLTSLS